MLEKVYEFSKSDRKIIEKLVDDAPLLINHMVLPTGEGLPEHYSNSNVYIIIIRGIMTLTLGDQCSVNYHGGQIINIPYKTKMNIINYQSDVLEFFVVKSPNPSVYKEYSYE